MKSERVVFTFVCLLILTVGAIVVAQDPPDPPRCDEWTPTNDPNVEVRGIDAQEHTYSGRTLQIGMRVRLSQRDRALDPEETGHVSSLAYGPGQTGVVLYFIRRRNLRYGFEWPMAVVRWDAQTWYEWDIPLNQMQDGVVYSAEEINEMNRSSGAAVELQSFVLAANFEVLEPI